ncbi:hypothetical protein O181_107514 [Austropuccinia psidii MF-1]|uniref:Uncharacterized protein n=1 Tax=Austropuccinia psidii MF-1 TaxID=1389203 RepID=A0A9Q3PN32_9BASI|nr:hypothetical protein [Austropuccinia psidii MF-1]
MPIQNSPPARQNRSQARGQAALTPTPRAPLDGTPAVPQLRANLDRGPNVEGEADPGRKEEGQEDKVIFQSFQGPLSKVLVKMSEPSLLAIMQQQTQIMANSHAASFYEASRPQAFKTPSMKASEFFDGTQPFKVRSFI